MDTLSPTTGAAVPKLRRRVVPAAPAAGRAIVDRGARTVFFYLLVTAGVVALFMALSAYSEIFKLALAPGAHFVNGRPLSAVWPKFLHTVSSAASIYDPRVLDAFERRAIDAHILHDPFAYPPSMMLLIWPLALLSPLAAFFLWFAASLAAYVSACRHRGFGVLTAMICVVAPSTIAVLLYAQVSLLAAAAIIGGFRLTHRRPILAGVLFGLATVKPQFGILVPLALISARQWRTVISAATTALLMVIASGVAFGWAAWVSFPGALNTVSAYVARHPSLAEHAPTITAGLRMLGAAPVVIDAAQLASAAGAVVTVWLCFRHGVTRLAIAALLVGTFFVTPYAFFYDLTLTTYAVLAVIVERYRNRGMLEFWELIVLPLVLALPALMLFGPSRIPWGMLVLTPFAWLILRQIAASRRQADRQMA